ncbi:carbonic anhydrase 4-like [Acanthochromis polyacanthus]|uniref:Carbonic anhydrase n=1 Tax=Acanthochromis polyacanthus TaxID=80966 RepID=A0A3Q1FNB0_9TELE|nr:carbonic anhydrase 4-like [Acanthochromis polyacanthus]
MNWFAVAALALCVIAPGTDCADDTIPWCYNLPTCNDTTWPVIAAPFCNGTKQSPINIVTANAAGDASLGPFTFVNYDNPSIMNNIENTGKTVKVNLNPGAKVSGGNLSEPYDSLQFHLHWGNGSTVPGSEHTVDGKQYPMELHIVNSKESLNRNTTLAVEDPEGLTALGFFIEALTDNSTGQPASWRQLIAYLENITIQNQTVSITPGITLNDLLFGVDRTQYWRYLGSLTTPACNEAVVWTVFKGTIKMSTDLIDRFSTVLRIGNSTSEHMVNVFRNVQPALPVSTQVSSTSGTSKTCYSLGLMALSVVLGRS